MADLRLQVLLSTVDKATKPLRSILQGSSSTANALRETRERLKELNRTQKDLDGFRKLRADARGTEGELQSAQQRVKTLAAEMKAADAPTKQLSREFNRAQEQARKLSERHKKQSVDLQGLRNRLGTAGVGTRNLGEHQRRLRAETEKTNRAMQMQQARLEKLARAQERSRKMHRTGMTATLHGAGAAYLGQRALRGTAATMMPGLNFTGAMSDVQSKTRLEKNDPRLKMLEGQARELGAGTAFTATEAAQGQVFLAQAGFSPEAIRDAMPAMLNTALAGDMELPRVADIVSNISGAFGIEAKNTQRVADVLTATSVTSNTNLEMLGETMKYVGPQARAMGVDLETASAMAGLLGNIGIQGDMAGTNLREVLTRVSDSAGPAGKALESIGVNAADSQGNLRNIVDVIADVGEATKDIGTADRAALFKQIFGQRAGSGMADLVTREGEGALSKYAASLRDVAGTAERVAKIKEDNLGGDLRSMKSAAEDVSITFFKELEPTLRSVSQTFTGLIRRVGQWAKEHPRLAKAVVMIAAVFGVLLTIGGALVFIFGSIMMATAGLGIAMTTAAPVFTALGGAMLWLKATAIPAVLAGFKALFGFLLTNPIGWIILAVAGAAYLIYRYWAPISGFFKGLWSQVTAAFAEGSGGVLRLLASWAGSIVRTLLNWNPLGLIYRGFTAGLSALGIEIPEKYRTLGSAVMDGLLGSITGSNLWAGIRSYFGGGWDLIAGIFTGDGGRIRGGLAQMWEGINTMLAGWPAKFLEWGGALIDGLVQGIKAKAGAIKEAITGAAGSAIGFFQEKLGIHSPSRVFAQFGGDTMEGYREGLRAQQREPLRLLAGFQRELRNLGAGLAIGAAAMPAVAIDQRPPVSTHRAPTAAAAPLGPITINIYAAPGMDEETIGRRVRAEIENLQRERSARRRASLSDYD